MAAALPTLSPLWRNSLRIWLAATLASGILFWSGRGQVVSVGLILAVMFVNENDLAPARSIAEVLAGALIGLLTAQVLHEISTGWVVVGIALLLSGVLIRALGLLKGLSTGYMLCWALVMMHPGNQVNWGLIFDLAFAAVVGILMAQVATWAVWPRHPLQQMPGLDSALAGQLCRQIRATGEWLRLGGPPPPPLRSQVLLPQIRQFQQPLAQRRSQASPAGSERLLRRWAQAGMLWSRSCASGCCWNGCWSNCLPPCRPRARSRCCLTPWPSWPSWPSGWLPRATRAGARGAAARPSAGWTMPSTWAYPGRCCWRSASRAKPSISCCGAAP